ncbi:CubicO group peptidase, beta-lactamase class C family [Algoriphagus alkaliphilus]|uniref:CubicO group peptidase, beta-lactamase class C family n=1 Tax=Algoriphagus alkaliphilus TaxID=279824 RepID=A0A1G5VV26_9BACT|nr:serine hydrolase domain-containing protein [Algoriphagus alkaliphilus]MBA4298574.1 serine hydrolase [Cyclobacterium sp.]SDA49077.1 CubicO group peptidase, beta-lactamase class C family [Algoriphagus alkaliphilus]
MKKRLILPLIFLFGISSQLFSQTLTSAGNQPVTGISKERLTKINAMLDEAVVSQQIPGLVAMIVKDGRIIYHEAKGLADVESGKKMEKNFIFRIASQTKAITSTAIMMLWEEGKFRLDDPISKYIPEFKNPQVLNTFRYGDTTYSTKASSREITIRHLLTHTSGLGYGVIDGDERMKMIYHKAGVMDLFTTENITIGESVKRLAKLPLHHEPGTKYTYSEGLDVLGYLVEIISGKSFDVFLKERIFDPLGMNDTRFYLNEAQAPRLVTVHTRKDGKWVPFPVTFYDPAYPKTGAKAFFSGGAGLSSTTEDYAKFLQLYLNGGIYNGKRILSPHTITTIMTNQVGDLLGEGGKDYGLAFGLVDEKGVQLGGIGSLGTFDWGGYFNTQYFADPKEKIIGLLFKQTSGAGNGDETGWKFRQMVFALIE